MEQVLDKLARIQKLWIELRAMKMDTPDYNTIIKQIGVLSAEYQALVDEATKSKGQK